MHSHPAARFVLSPFLFVVLLPAADWPQFLGPSRSGETTEPITTSGWKLAWKKDVGAGFAGPVLAGGKLILFQRVQNNETVECMDPKTGRRLWIFEYATSYRDDFGFDEGPRGTPTVLDGRVYTFGAEGVLHALDLATGKKLWRVDTHQKFAVRKGFFGAAASPLVDANNVYVNVGGPSGAGLVAFDRQTGAVRWSATNDDAGYSSPILTTLGGVRAVLCVTRAGLVAAEAATGRVRFTFPFRSRSGASVNAAVPVVDGNYIFLSASYNTGAVLLRAEGESVKPVWSGDEALSNHYATSVLKGGYLYGFHGRQEMGQSFRCIEMRTGKVQWNVDGFGAGTVTLSGDRLLIIRESGEAVVAAASPKSFQIQGKTQLLPAVVRSYPAIGGGRIYVRNEGTLSAWEIGK